MIVKNKVQHGWFSFWTELAREDCPVLIAWTLQDDKQAVSDLKERMKFFCPGEMDCILFYPTTSDCAEETFECLASSRIGSSNWFEWTDEVDSIIASIREERREEDVEVEPGDLEARWSALWERWPTTTALKPKYQQRRRARTARKTKAKPVRASRQRRVNTSSRRVAA